MCRSIAKKLPSYILSICFLIIPFLASGQYSKQDSLRGSITNERAWWDLTYYHLDIAVDPTHKSIQGSVDIHYTVLNPLQKMQIDLQPPLKISRIEDEKGNELGFTSDGNAHFIELREKQRQDDRRMITVYYGGIPKEAIRPPWDGGISWDKDENGQDIIHSNCQGIGASIWWPCKDHMYDEPDSMLISVNVPSHLMDVSNGRLREVEEHENNTTTFHWFVSNPISNYVININIADYTHFGEVYEGANGQLDMDYYVMPYNLTKARKQFKDATRMMEAFEFWFGPYPFYEDGYKLVEVPSTGMEHQSSVTYGNGYENGYRGRDGSGTGWGFKFDFIIIHESGHEWFANNITYKDVADMWIHESFTNYSESLFLEYFYGKPAGQEYVRGTRRQINNDRPIIGDYGVNRSGSGDMYVKGGNMLNTLRTVINDDQKWINTLRGLNEEFYHQTVTTENVESYISFKSKMGLKSFFDQYLRDIRIPVLEYYFRDDQLNYRWSNAVDHFDMPVRAQYGEEEFELSPTTKWQSLETTIDADVKPDPNYYITTFNLMK